MNNRLNMIQNSIKELEYVVFRKNAKMNIFDNIF